MPGHAGAFETSVVMALRPDLVIIHAFGYASLPGQMQLIEQAGVPILVVDYNAQKPELHAASTLALGHAMGALDRARSLVDLYTSKIRDMVARLAGVAARPKAYVELGQGGPGVVGNSYSKAMWGEMIDLAGGTNIAKQLHPERFADVDPVASLRAYHEAYLPIRFEGTWMLRAA